MTKPTSTPEAGLPHPAAAAIATAAALTVFLDTRNQYPTRVSVAAWRKVMTDFSPAEKQWIYDTRRAAPKGARS
ncbi:MAG TPA: hypothetical protein VHO69_03420 [Phototrophicaceae bacterium]|nr:hypothetical protein [Phototrophicaceae bacterium]